MKSYLHQHRLLFTFGLSILFSTEFLTSCKTTKNQDGAQYATNGSYATSPSDGHYNPYPSGGTPAATSSTQSQYQQYNEAPPPPSQPKKSTASATSSKKKSSTTGKTAAASKSSSITKKTASTTTKKKTPGSTASKTTSSASGPTYVVKQSDTLYGIAHKKHVTVSKLKIANNLTSDVIRAGMKLKIP